MASGKPANVNCFLIASPSSVHPFREPSRCWTSSGVSFIVRLNRHTAFMSSTAVSAERPPRPNFVQTEPRGVDGVKRFPLDLDCRCLFRGIGERATGNGALIDTLGQLQRLEGGSVLVLPIEP